MNVLPVHPSPKERVEARPQLILQPFEANMNWERFQNNTGQTQDCLNMYRDLASDA